MSIVLLLELNEEKKQNDVIYRATGHLDKLLLFLSALRLSKRVSNRLEFNGIVCNIFFLTVAFEHVLQSNAKINVLPIRFTIRNLAFPPEGHLDVLVLEKLI